MGPSLACLHGESSAVKSNRRHSSHSDKSSYHWASQVPDKNFADIILFYHHIINFWGDATVVPILQMRRLRLRVQNQVQICMNPESAPRRDAVLPSADLEPTVSILKRSSWPHLPGLTFPLLLLFKRMFTKTKTWSSLTQQTTPRYC